VSWKRNVHPACDPACEHAPTGPDQPQIVQLNATQFTREDGEGMLAREHPGEPIFYLGVHGPTRGGDDPWPVHAWQVGGEMPTGFPPRAVHGTTKPTNERKDTAIYRPEVWLGSGEPVPPLDMSRPAPEVEVAFPVPVVGATAEPEGSVVKPKPVVDLEKYAAAHGWDYMTTYACGWVPHATHGRPTSEQPKESWGVRLRRGGQRAVAVRMGATWASMWTWSGTDRFTHHKTLSDFREALV
jgi:hypothetical protein